MDNFDLVLGLGLRDWKPLVSDIPKNIQVLLSEREQVRAEKDWAKADDIRETLNARGWRVEDSKEGQRLIGITTGATDIGHE